MKKSGDFCLFHSHELKMKKSGMVIALFLFMIIFSLGVYGANCGSIIRDCRASSSSACNVISGCSWQIYPGTTTYGCVAQNPCEGLSTNPLSACTGNSFCEYYSGNKCYNCGTESSTSGTICKTLRLSTCTICAPATCQSLGKNCGSWSDNCGGTLNCGTCASGQTCNNGVCSTSAAQYTASWSYAAGSSGTGHKVKQQVGTNYNFFSIPGSLAVNSGTSITLIANATPGYKFVSWGGACSGAGNCILTMNANKAITLNFIATAKLTATKTGDGTGTITSNPTGINYGADNWEDYASGTIVTLTATPATGSRFIGWSGACSGTSTCVVTMNSAKTATATFKKIYRLTVTKTPATGGTITSNPTGINYGSDNYEDYASGTIVTLTATPATGYVLSGWSNACSGTSTCVVTMNSAKTATATFSNLFTTDQDKDGYSPSQLDCDDNLGDDDALCRDEVTCCKYGTTGQGVWRSKVDCASSDILADSSCSGALKTNMCNSLAFSECSYCRNPGRTKRECGVDSKCEGWKLSGTSLVKRTSSEVPVGFVLLNNNWVYNGYMRADNQPYPCYEDEQCVIGGSKEVPTTPIEGAFAFNVYSFVPGAVEGDAKCGIVFIENLYSGGSTVEEKYQCLPDSENKIINTRYGEMEKTGFERFVSNLVIKPYALSSDSAKFSWQSACVKKDKCMDGVGNDKSERLDVFLNLKNVKSQREASKQPYVSLADVDDPDCQDKCIDNDKDTWCANSIFFPDCQDNPAWKFIVPKYKKTIFGGWTEVPEVIHRRCEELSSEEYGKIGVPTLTEIASEGYTNDWNEYNYCKINWRRARHNGKLLNSRDIHPFAYIDPSSGRCNLGFDINCNKNGDAGYNLDGLSQGISPFDKDETTGVEMMGISRDVDAFCSRGKPSCFVYLTNRISSFAKSLVGWQGLGGTVIYAAAVKLVGATAAAKLMLIFGTYFTFNAIGNDLYYLWFDENVWKKGEQCYKQVDLLLDTALGLLIMKSATNLPYANKPVFYDPIKDPALTPEKLATYACNAEKIKPVKEDGCFLAGTKILMEDGSYKNIEDIKQGERVAAYDVENNIAGNASVTETFVRNASSYLIINYEIIE